MTAFIPAKKRSVAVGLCLRPDSRTTSRPIRPGPGGGVNPRPERRGYPFSAGSTFTNAVNPALRLMADYCSRVGRPPPMFRLDKVVQTGDFFLLYLVHVPAAVTNRSSFWPAGSGNSFPL